MFTKNWFNLQFFAEGGEGGDGAETGESTADAGQDSRLRELGVPQRNLDKLRSRGKKAPAVAKATEEKAQDAVQPEAQAAEAPEGTAGMTWDEFFSVQENKDKFEGIIKDRVKRASKAEETLEKAKNFHALAAKKYGMDPENIDFDALTERAFNDDSNFEEQALTEGKPVEEVKRKAAEDLRQQMAQRQVQGWLKQGEELKTLYPDFNFDAEFKGNTEFKRLIFSGVPVKTAYTVTHMDEIQAKQSQVVAQATMQKAANAVISGSQRPAENGTGAKAASTTTFNPRNASRKEREEFKQRVMKAAAQGIYIRPGG